MACCTHRPDLRSSFALPHPDPRRWEAFFRPFAPLLCGCVPQFLPPKWTGPNLQDRPAVQARLRSQTRSNVNNLYMPRRRRLPLHRSPFSVKPTFATRALVNQRFRLSTLHHLGNCQHFLAVFVPIGIAQTTWRKHLLRCARMAHLIDRVVHFCHVASACARAWSQS